MTTITHTDAPIISTRIPEQRSVRGLQYGAHVSKIGWSGYYVRPVRRHGGKWAIARLTPASDELPGTGSDRAIVAAIRDEFAAL